MAIERSSCILPASQQQWNHSTMRWAKRTQLHSWAWPAALSALAIFAFGLRWYYVSTALVLNPVRGDAVQYFSYAWNLANHGVFAKSIPGSITVLPDNYRDPGYPAFLAIWMKAYGAGDTWYASVLVCQAALGAIGVALATHIGKSWLGSRWAIAAGIMAAAWPHGIAITGYLLSETLFGFLSLLALAAAIRAFAVESSVWAGVAGLAFGAAALTNAVLLPFGVVLGCTLLLAKRSSARICVVLAAFTLVLPGAWAVRNAQIPPATGATTSTDRALQNLVQGAWPSYHPAWRASVLGTPAEKNNAERVLSSIEQEFALLRRDPATGARSMFVRMSEHPWQMLGWYVCRKPANLWGWDIQIGQGDIYVYPTKNSPFQNQPAWIAWEAICHTVNYALFLLAIAGACVAWRRRSGAPDWTNAAAVAVSTLFFMVTLIYTLLQAEPRYSIPFRPLEMMLATTTLAMLSRSGNRLRAHIEH